MNKRAAALTLALAIGGGYAISANWDAIRDGLGLAEISPEHLRAIDLAKSDYNLSHHLTNHAVIDGRVRSSRKLGRVIGWHAERELGDVFLVTYLFKEDGVQHGYYFEVNVGSLQVRKVRGNPELEKRYGIPPAPR